MYSKEAVHVHAAFPRSKPTTGASSVTHSNRIVLRIPTA